MSGKKWREWKITYTGSVISPYQFDGPEFIECKPDAGKMDVCAVLIEKAALEEKDRVIRELVEALESYVVRELFEKTNCADGSGPNCYGKIGHLRASKLIKEHSKGASENE